MLPGPPPRHQGYLHMAPQQYQHQWPLWSWQLLLYPHRPQLHPWNMLRQSHQTLHHLRNRPEKSHKNNLGVKSYQFLQWTQPLTYLRPGKCPLNLIFSLKISVILSSIIHFNIPFYTIDQIYSYPTPKTNKFPYIPNKFLLYFHQTYHIFL